MLKKIIFLVVFGICGLVFGEMKTNWVDHYEGVELYSIKFVYNDSFVTRPATMPLGVPHYDATITVYTKTINGLEAVSEPFKGIFTDGKCWEDNPDSILRLVGEIRYVPVPYPDLEQELPLIVVP